MQHSHYPRLAAMTGLSFLAMYVLMYAMVDSLENVFNNVNQVYMAGLMAAPMVVIELLLMGSMYENKRLNMLLLTGAIVAGLAFFLGIRQQTAVGDEQFLRSMIPHHAGAILMCREASLQDPDIRALCLSIIESQESEIRLMKPLLER